MIAQMERIMAVGANDVLWWSMVVFFLSASALIGYTCVAVHRSVSGWVPTNFDFMCLNVCFVGTAWSFLIVVICLIVKVAKTIMN